MLVRYRKDYQKIALGLLSLVADLRRNNRFMEELDWATANDWPIFLWKDMDDSHFIGIIILEIGDYYVLIRRLSFTPSERSGHNIFSLLNAVHDQYSGKRLLGTLATQPIISMWERNNE
ncbi:reductase [Lactobacillus sp. 0.1XD8-4]|uniref:Reductase n=1 Tax=Limosilactobacillus walteri TaxID=2268022 RepID=A0ABR8P7B7_9LACO|nr:reductase [Limosilactobacillus walteri]MBD5806594.1 reductase [Limosilactobacillus walteri]MRN06885.1 reductase [Lactobacillus sp. 0.1XD8-4]